MSNITDTVINFLNKYNLSNKTIVVGFSGGYDSMCLLHALSKIRERDDFEDLEVIAAHFNHNWRGNESLTEQEVCRLFASGCGFEFVAKTAPSDLKKTENDARLARYDFFEEIYEDYDADAVFTAHNKDDNAETVLYRVVKGTGLFGLKGISERRKFFYRPLLHVSRADILKYCEENNLCPNNDSSNSDITYNRNYLRHKIIPDLEKINPSVKDSLVSLADVASSENSIIEEYLAGIRPEIFDGETIRPEKFIKLSYPVRLRFVHEYMRRFDLDYDFKRIKEITDFIDANSVKRNGNTISLTSSTWLYVDDKVIEIIPHRKNEEDEYEKLKHIEVKIPGVGEYAFAEYTLKLKEYVDKDVFVFPESTSNFVYVDLDKFKSPLTLRTRRDGDIICPFGMTGTMKLKKYLNAKGIPRHKRDKLLLLANENEILWVVGVGLSSRIGVVKVPTHVIEVTRAEDKPENEEVQNG